MSMCFVDYYSRIISYRVGKFDCEIVSKLDIGLPSDCYRIYQNLSR